MKKANLQFVMMVTGVVPALVACVVYVRRKKAERPEDKE